MSLLTEARQTVTDALTANDIPAVMTTPAVLIPPVVIVEPTDPWIVNWTLQSVQVSLGLSVVVNVSDQATALANLESLVDDVLAALPGGSLLEGVAVPQYDDTGSQGQILRSTITIQLAVRNP